MAKTRIARSGAGMAAWVLLCLSCAGGVSSSGMPDRRPPAGLAPPGAATSPLLRLSRVEYENTVRDLLGAAAVLPEGFSADALGPHGFSTGGLVSGAETSQYLEAAEALAQRAVEDLVRLLPCDPRRAGEAACAAAFIERFGLRAFRRPLTDIEREELLGIYAQAERSGDPFRERIRLVLAALLQAPPFLYRGGPFDDGTAYDLATRLSYFLWASTPDDALLAAARDGRLVTPEDVEREARRMLGDERARAGLRRFQAGWLALEYGGGLVKDARRFREWSENLIGAIRAETPRFVEEVVLRGDARLETLLTAPFSFVDPPLARLYGVPHPTGEGVARVGFPPEHGRSGLLTQALLLAKNAGPSVTSPTRRGHFVREHLLCQTLPPPPLDADTTPPKARPDMSIRDQMMDHGLKLACAECHDLMDPIGFAFERFDAIGRLQAEDAGRPIDDSGELEQTDVDGRFTGAVELGRRLASSELVRRCFARQVFRLALGRLERGEEPDLEASYQTFADSGFDVRELLVAVTRTGVFRAGAVR